MKNRLEEIRKQRGLTQEELAKALEVSRQTIGAIENDRYNPSIMLAFKIARFSEKAIEDVFIYETGKRHEECKKMINFTIIGFALIIIGIELTRTIKQPREFIEILPMCMVIIGCFILGRNLGNLMVHFSLKDSPELSKSIEIERNDERNIMIYNKAKAKALDIMTSYVNIAIIIALALIRSNIWIIILFSAYSLLFIKLFYLIKYYKKCKICIYSFNLM